ncbi:uncharacterized protein METZ01_LOCUS268372 [marine metagenome]|uniref:Uncharacterized protein n=1 Tax=marine metagenome TaxID=408172 RepID=A0A382JUH6_9ZZZZ
MVIIQDKLMVYNCTKHKKHPWQINPKNLPDRF